MQILHSVYLFTVVGRSVLENTGNGAKNGATLVFLSIFIWFDGILCYINIRMTVSNRLKLIGDIGELIVNVESVTVYD